MWLSLKIFTFTLLITNVDLSGNSYYPRPPPIPACPDFTSTDIKESFIQAKKKIREIRDEEVRITGEGKILDDRCHHAEVLHQKFTMTFEKSMEMERIAENYEEATRILHKRFNFTKEQINTELPKVDLRGKVDSNINESCQQTFAANCTNTKYRSFDGSCNNLLNPHWGKAFTCLKRMLPPDYADGLSQPRTGQNGPLPFPRELSVTIHRQIRPQLANGYSHMAMLWGQFLAHDITLTPISLTAENQRIQCCPNTNDNHQQCLPVLVSEDDYFYSQFGKTCLNFVRSAICSLCTLGPRQQSNQLSAYVDASQIYGTDVNTTASLRTNSGNGKLIMTDHMVGGELLPQSLNPTTDLCSRPNENLLCFRAGDVRLNQHPSLVGMHTIWAREHNRLADKLKSLNPSWSGEQIYQEARRIVIAEVQMITWGEFLPLILGDEYMEFYYLNVAERNYLVYDPTIDATLYNEFTAAAFRFGHSLIDGVFNLVTSQDEKSSIRLRKNFFSPFGLYNGQLDGLMRGASRQPSGRFDELLVNDVTNHLHQRNGDDSGLDLASINIQRGRDHGISGYTAYQRHLFHTEIDTFDGLLKLMPLNVVRKLESMYDSVHDIDLFTGGIAEYPVKGGIVGPVLASIVGGQFYRLKYGDRFYFEHSNQEGSFPLGKLQEIRKVTLARVLCDNTDIHEIQRNVFKYPSLENPIVPCSNIPSMGLCH